jgi:hypothetical protein
MASLNLDASVSDVVRAAAKAAPTVPNQAQALLASDVRALVAHWEAKGDWYSCQLATMVAIGFYRLLRLGELRLVPTAGVRYVLSDGREYAARDTEPRPHTVRAVLLLVCWRKQHKQMFTWVPVSGRRSITMLLQQRARARAAMSAFLFPSRKCSPSGAYMNELNPIGAAQFIKQLRAALEATVLLGTKVNVTVLLSFRGHSLRVGGLNDLRRRGVDPETRRLLGVCASVLAQSRDEQLPIAGR